MVCLKILIFLITNVKRIVNTIANAMYISILVLYMDSIYNAIVGVKIIAGMV